MAEPTSVLTFEDLILETALKLGTAYYGPNGDEEPQIPTDVHDLSVAKRHVNSAIRMFIADAPPAGWRWMRPVASVVLWPSVAVDATNPVVSAGYNPTTGKTTLTVTDDSFYASMELRTITLTGVGDFVIADYVSATQIRVTGDASAAGASGVTWSMTANGDYTLPRDFGGQATSRITYAANTQIAVQIDWTDEAYIRQWRQDVSEDTGDPVAAAIRLMGTGTPRRRWELVTYPIPAEVRVIEFPYVVGFEKLEDLDETPPAPFNHDETIRAACRAVVERDEFEAVGVDFDYYKKSCLPGSIMRDAQSAPRRLGYFGNPRRLSQSELLRISRAMTPRPDVAFNP